MKDTTRGKHNEHKARMAMRELRGETLKPVGEKRLTPPHGRRLVTEFLPVSGMVHEINTCAHCGYHVCSCEHGDIRARVNKFLEDSRGKVARLEREPYGYCSPFIEGLAPVDMNADVATVQRVGRVVLCTPREDGDGFDAVVELGEPNYGNTRDRAWLREFGPVSLGDMAGMCAAFALTKAAQEHWLSCDEQEALIGAWPTQRGCFYVVEAVCMESRLSYGTTRVRGAFDCGPNHWGSAEALYADVEAWCQT